MNSVYDRKTVEKKLEEQGFLANEVDVSASAMPMRTTRSSWKVIIGIAVVVFSGIMVGVAAKHHFFGSAKPHPIQVNTDIMLGSGVQQLYEHEKQRKDWAPGTNATWRCIQGFCMIKAVKQWMNKEDYKAINKNSEDECRQSCLRREGCTSYVWAPHRHPVLAGRSCILWLNYACDIERSNGLVWCHSDSGLSAGAGWTCCKPNEKTKTCQLRRNLPLNVSAKWEAKHTLAGATTISLTTGVTQETSVSRFIGLSSSISTKMGPPAVDGMTSEMSSELTTTMSKEFTKTRSMSEVKEFTVKFIPGTKMTYLWQWVYNTILEDGTVIEQVGTKEYAVTAGKWEKPNCLPGYAIDAPKYQKCVDDTHTIDLDASGGVALRITECIIITAMAIMAG